MHQRKTDRHTAHAGELKAAAEEMLRMGARYLEAGRAWLAENRRQTMKERGPDDRQDQRQDRTYDRGYDERASRWASDEPRYGAESIEDDRYEAPWRRVRRGDGWREPGNARARPGSEAGPASRRSEGERGMYGAYGPDAGRSPHRSYEDADLQRVGRAYGQQRGYQDEAPTYYDDTYGSYRVAPAYGSAHHDERNLPGATRGFDDESSAIGSPGSPYRTHPGYRANRDFNEDGSYRSPPRDFGEGYGHSSGYGRSRGYRHSRYGAELEDGMSEQRDVQSKPSNRGRGPVRYTRSDERILEDINERLTDDDLVDARDIDVLCTDGRIVLQGTVPDRWMKHRAEDLAEACVSVKDVENRIRVALARAEMKGEAHAPDTPRPNESRSASGGTGSAATTGSGPSTPQSPH